MKSLISLEPVRRLCKWLIKLSLRSRQRIRLMPPWGRSWKMKWPLNKKNCYKNNDKEEEEWKRRHHDCHTSCNTMTIRRYNFSKPQKKTSKIPYASVAQEKSQRAPTINQWILVKRKLTRLAKIKKEPIEIPKKKIVK